VSPYSGIALGGTPPERVVWQLAALGFGEEETVSDKTEFHVLDEAVGILKRRHNDNVLQLGAHP
jgi:hypothetical protein